MFIRPFELADAGALADIFHASVREAGIHDYSPEQVEAWSPSRPDPGTYVRKANSRTILVAVATNGRVIGYGDIELNGHIDHLYVSPDRVGKGVGSALYAALEDIARKAGITCLFVEASEAAKRLFERRGFRVDARHDFTMNGVAIHNYRMSKSIC
ncbi:GNAT family N-acetyltransferase [Carnimonas nigrificans]|uniref:GNAT family N-acetyltransferase n=1 Tax=Carnimonas nigrificans TaxID=64323 RepID=UPI0004709890|nr:GNAT family N-acetyltransferase [Carnimonas nigrificans]